MSKIERLLQKKQELQGSFDLLSQKLVRLRNARAIEEAPGMQFELDQQIERLEAERKNVEHYLEAIEALGDVTEIEAEGSRIEYGIEAIIEKLQGMDIRIEQNHAQSQANYAAIHSMLRQLHLNL